MKYPPKHRQHLRARPAHVDRIPGVKLSPAVRHARVSKITLALRQTVDPSACSTRIAPARRRASRTSASTRVVDRVDLRPNVMYSIICQFAHATMATKAMRSHSAIQNRRSLKRHVHGIIAIHHRADQTRTATTANARALPSTWAIRTRRDADRNAQPVPTVAATKRACAANAWTRVRERVDLLPSAMWLITYLSVPVQLDTKAIRSAIVA